MHRYVIDMQITYSRKMAEDGIADVDMFYLIIVMSIVELNI